MKTISIPHLIHDFNRPTVVRVALPEGFAMLIRLASVALATAVAGHAVGAGTTDTDLGEAVRAGDAVAVERALADGADPDTAAGNLPPLVVAAVRGDVDVARVLLEGGADPDAAGSDERTALIQALVRGREDVARLLIESGADVNRREAAPGRSAPPTFADRPGPTRSSGSRSSATAAPGRLDLSRPRRRRRRTGACARVRRPSSRSAPCG